MKLKFAILLLSVIQVTNLFSEDFSKGKYYTINGEKIEGLLSIQRTKLSAIYFKPCVLKFKKDDNSKPIKLENLSISSFVIGKDSFTVVQNFRVTYHMGFLKGIFWGNCRRDFAKVIQQGKINSFELSCEVFLGQYGYEDYSYFVLSKDNQDFKTFDLKLDKEKQNLIEYFSNQEDLRDIILKTNYKEINIIDLVGLYNKR